MRNKPIITIITATYNVVKTLRQTIESVVNQTYNDIEYIIIDGGSTDGTVDIIKEYADRIAYWVSEPDKGIYNAFNKGIKVATGDYIQFLGADDCLVDKDTISKVVLNLTPGIDLLSTGMYIVDEETLLESFLGNEIARNKRIYIGEMIPHPGMFAKKNILLKYSFDEDFKIAADYKFFLQVYNDKAVNISYIDLPVVFFALSGISSNNVQLLNEENNKIWTEFHLDKLRQKNAIEKQNGFKGMIKKFLKLTKMFVTVKGFINLHFRGWRHHQCNWEHCRWCGRK